MVSRTRLWNGPTCQDIISIRKINLHSTQHEQWTGHQEPNTPDESPVYIGNTQGDECITLDSTHHHFQTQTGYSSERSNKSNSHEFVRAALQRQVSTHIREVTPLFRIAVLAGNKERRTRPTAVSTVTQHFFPSCRLDVVSQRVKHRGLHGRGSLTIVTSPFRAWEQTILVPVTDLATSQTRSCASPRAESNTFMHVPNKMWEVAGAQKKKTEAGFCHVHQLFRQMPQRPGPLDPPSASRMVPARHHTPHQPTTMSMSDEAMVWLSAHPQQTPSDMSLSHDSTAVVRAKIPHGSWDQGSRPNQDFQTNVSVGRQKRTDTEVQRCFDDQFPRPTYDSSTIHGNPHHLHHARPFRRRTPLTFSHGSSVP